MTAAVRRLVLLLGLLVSPVIAADAFIAGTSDVPLMPGLRALSGDGTVFDVPGGRVVEAWAEGGMAREAVLSFYGATLPQLGWTATGSDRFRREGEVLRVEFPPQGPRGARASGTLLVRFYLSPG
jgi:hypothetical protein